MGHPHYAHICDKLKEAEIAALDLLGDGEFGLPMERQQLQKHLLKKKLFLTKLKSKKKSKEIINNAQWKLLFPEKMKDFDPSKFDINLIVILARYFTNEPKPAEWKKPLLKHNKSKVATLRRLKKLRNQNYHQGQINQSYVKEFWNQFVPVVEALGKTNIKPCYKDSYKEFLEDCMGVLPTM
ncbi:uncharacterized protein LOC130629790 [Hydractinia symbiolongicarpus]|uniref:uncharacterized protein LOC130629790 n=1 Tax=Hydractinia symbiolongicarpus TaxID=13093 RepID=UPI00254FA96E|nr:uncharacterized protein LOC130629790 [Hydractinia symbiolongicarpus]XP_057299115.1 uncharacterized protein LOC130629790 [Hydractinia symbiolongicarpus]XP_057299116.1 uncharacterized protein LOC130629790 [Hydractinia symbiolongicarpus]